MCGIKYSNIYTENVESVSRVDFILQKWKTLEDHVTTVHILSQDNVKYLYALEKFTQPLYRLNPTKVGDYVPALMYAIRMIYATSRFFNTRRMVTAIYVKVNFSEIIY